MSKKIFICGKIYDLATQTTKQLETKIQKRIDKMLENETESGERLVALRLNIDETTNEITLTFHRNNLFAKVGKNPELINDSDAQLIMGLDGKFIPPVMWDYTEPFAFNRYHVPLYEFVPAYVGSASQLGASELKGLQIESTKTELTLKIKI